MTPSSPRDIQNGRAHSLDNDAEKLSVSPNIKAIHAVLIQNLWLLRSIDRLVKLFLPESDFSAKDGKKIRRYR